MFGLGNRCAPIRRLISDAVDEPLSKRRQKRLDRHLRHCHACRDEAEFYANLKETASTLDAVSPPTYLWERISLQIDEHPWGEDDHPARAHRPALPRIWPRSLDIAGAMATVALIALLCLTPSSSSDTSTALSSSSIRAEEYHPDTAYLSLYMMAQGDRFPSQVRDYYLNQLDGLDTKIKMIKSTLKRFPNNRQVRAQLVKAYGQKIKLYRRMGLTSDEDRVNINRLNSRFDFDRGGCYE